MTPLRPEDATAAKKVTIPAEVFEAFDELIAEGWDGKNSTVNQDEVIERILSKLQAVHRNSITRKDIFDKGWLDVEAIYRADGWDVYYDKPAYNETYTATFEFTKLDEGVVSGLSKLTDEEKKALAKHWRKR